MDKHKHSLLEGNVRELLGKDDPVIFEIGCNDGVDSLKFLELFPGCLLICFEVDPRAILQFRERIQDKRCRLVTCAASDTDGRATFYQSDGTTAGAHKESWDLSGSLNKPTGHLEQSPWCTFDNQITVPTRRLDGILDFWDEDPQLQQGCDLLWVDVQGAERKVFDGAREFLKCTRFVYTEFCHYKKPLYEGSMNLEETIAKLGSDWEPLSIWEGYNLLAVNKTLRG